MDAEELKTRTKQFGLKVIQMVSVLPARRDTDILGRQLIRSATAVGANYRAACRAQSRNDFIAKIKIVEEEADESAYWLDMLIQSGLASRNSGSSLLTEAEELTAIFAASAKTARSNRQLSIVNRQ